MQTTRPKFLPLLLCFTVVGVLAATMPHPAFSGNIQVMDTQN